MPPAPDAARAPWWSPADGEGLRSPSADAVVPAPRAGGRRARAPRPGTLAPARAVAGALVSVAGVVLGIGTLLWATDEPPQGDPVVRPPAPATASEPADVVLDEPALPAPSPVPSAVPSPVPPVAPAPPAAPLEIPVLVLNNSRIDGLAERTAQRLEAGGWPVRDIGSLRGRIRATTVYYDAGQREAARELARRFPWVQRVLPRLAGLPGTGLTLVVTRDAA